MDRHEAIAVLKNQYEACHKSCPRFGANFCAALDYAIRNLERMDDRTTGEIPRA
jgi:hypothetical protein